MSAYDAFVVTLIVIGICSGVIFILGLVEMTWPWLERNPRPQATYRIRKA
jgi:hypothetical protein